MPLLLSFLFLMLTSNEVLPSSSSNSFFEGCLFFIEDARTSTDAALARSFRPNALIRSWYRFGEPHPEKTYSLRSDFVRTLKKQGVSTGGGSSLSVVNNRDLANPQFNRSWLTTNLDGTIFHQDGTLYGSLSHPGFRSYIISKVLDQVRTGIEELHFGESTGKIRYEDWSLGLAGDAGFIQWVQNKYRSYSLEWWKNHLGEVGEKIALRAPINRELFKHLSKRQKDNFQLEWGEEDSWHGNGSSFLAHLYRTNLENFLTELKAALRAENLRAAIDVWGVADWMASLKTQPDAYIASPPDDRKSKYRWNSEPLFPVERYRNEIRQWMERDVNTVAPVPVVFMFDHPNPFYSSFSKLSDNRQAYLTKFFADLSAEVHSNFVFRGYSLPFEKMGPETRATIMNECTKRRRY